MGKVVPQSIAFRVVSIYWQEVAPFPWYLNAEGPTPIGSTCVAHTSPHSVAVLRDITSVTNLRSAHWLASDFHSWINSWINCQTNVYTIWLSIQQFNQLSNQQLDRLFIQLSDPYKPCKCTIMLVGKLPLIRGKTTWNWQRTVLSADAGLLVVFMHCILVLLCFFAFHKHIILSVIFEANLGYLVAPWFSTCACSKGEPEALPVTQLMVLNHSMNAEHWSSWLMVGKL